MTERRPISKPVYGAIDDYWCNQDELETAFGYLLNALELGANLVQLVRQVPKPQP